MITSKKGSKEGGRELNRYLERFRYKFSKENNLYNENFRTLTRLWTLESRNTSPAHELAELIL